MNFDLVQPVRFFIAIMKYIGLWRLDNRWQSLYAVYAYSVHFFFTLLMILTMWVRVFTSKDIEQFSESLYMSLCEVGLLAKVLNIFYFSKDAVHFFELVEDEDIRLQSPAEMRLFKKAHRMFHYVGRFYISASVGVVGGAFTVVALGHKWTLPYPAWMPFELHSEYYWYAYAHQLVGMVVTCLGNVCIDILQCYFLHHLSLVYLVIGYRLAHIGFNVGTATGREVDKLILGDLIKIIKAHELVKRITRKCERFMSFPFFMQISVSALVLCFTGFQLRETSPLDNPGQFIGMVDFLIVMGLQIFLPCYYANQVTIQSGQLSEALYCSNWIALPPKSRRLICLYMEFLKDPVYVKAGKFFNIGLPIFSKTINNAYSFFAVLIRMKN